MIRSMTGFGAAERDTSAGRLAVEVRTVNHRFLNLNVRLPRSIDRMEPQVRDALRPFVRRGHVNVTVRVGPVDDQGLRAAPPVRADLARARQYLAALARIRDDLGLAGEVTLADLLRFGDILVAEEEAGPDVGPEDLAALVTEAGAEMARMREDEGRSLAADMEERLRALEASIDAVRVRAPERLAAERERLRAAVAELADGIQIDEGRLAQEIAILAERWDVAEEIVRLESHVRLFRELMDEAAEEPVGKRLAFLVQEMNRETNTIGSKANDAVVEHRVVEIKNEIERLREQVENVE